jgi:predicted helicase
MLLPYYIASMNIEHEYLAQTGEYRPFDGICLVDTFELAEPEQGGLEFMTEENTERVKRQKQAPIFVIIGNPPYNMGQVNENDQNKNRRYPIIDGRIAATYRKDSHARLTNKLNDPYVKAIRWATDRLSGQGIVAFITNNSFIDQIAFDGMRAHLREDFDAIYLLDLGGNVRKNPKLSGTTHNVFGIQVGVSINLFLRLPKDAVGPRGVFYARLEEYWRKEEKYAYLESVGSRAAITWQELVSDEQQNWLTADLDPTYSALLPLGSKDDKAATKKNVPTVFKLFSLGVATNRDAWAYNFSELDLSTNMRRLIGNYNSEVYRYEALREPERFQFNDDDSFVKWTDRLKEALFRRTKLNFATECVRRSLYRPFTSQYL